MSIQVVNRLRKTNIDQVYRDMVAYDNQLMTATKQCDKTAGQIAQEIMEAQNQLKFKRVQFAGKNFIVNEKGEITEEIQDNISKELPRQPCEFLTPKDMRSSFRHFRDVVKRISSKKQIGLEIVYNQGTVGVEDGVEQEEWIGSVGQTQVPSQEQGTYETTQEIEIINIMNKNANSKTNSFQLLLKKKPTTADNSNATKQQFNNYLKYQGTSNVTSHNSNTQSNVSNSKEYHKGAQTSRTNTMSPPKQRVVLTYRDMSKNNRPTTPTTTNPSTTRATTKITNNNNNNKQLLGHLKSTQVTKSKITSQNPIKQHNISPTSTRSTIVKTQDKSRSVSKQSLNLTFQSETNNNKRALTPTAKLDIMSPIYSLFSPIFKDAIHYQTSLIHFHYELIRHKPSPYTVQFNLEYNTKPQREYFKDLYLEHFIQNYNSLQYCKNITQKNKNIIKLPPPQTPLKCKGNIIRTIIFDLDETLIHCNDSNDDPTDHTIMIDFPNEEPMQTRINIRPYCTQMLKLLSNHYELILFTASQKYYADKVIQLIDPHGQYFKHRFYRDHCLRVEEGLYIKDLRVIGNRQLENMVLVDNAAYSYCLQLDNGVPIIPFYDNKFDKELKYLTYYLLSLDNHPNQSYINKMQFRQYLYQQGNSINECLDELIKCHDNY